MFDTLIIGEIAQDTNVDYDGTTVRAIGGAVYYSAFAAAGMGFQIAVLPKADTRAVDLRAAFAPMANIAVFPLHSDTSFVTTNVYHAPDRERRTSTVDSVISPYKPEEVPDIQAHIWHLAGLVAGDIPNEMIPFAAERAQVALDVQTMLRHAENGQMVYRDWAEKKTYLPYIHFLKTDAAEAEIMTGLSEREAAARLLYAWGAKEVMITHNTEVLVFDGSKVYTCPIRARNLSGRTGRGDTTFCCYINERREHGIAEALKTATALVSLKMETPGPYRGARTDVEQYMSSYFADC